MHGPSKKKLDREARCCKREVSSYGPLGVSIGCANFLEDVKVHLVIQPLNAQYQRNETWQAGQDRRRLDAAKEKCPHMGPLGSLWGVPTFWRM
jgi:hypothetical protein